MKHGFDVAVVGGGAIGLSCAWKLAQSGARVVVLEAGTNGHGASWAAGGMLAPSGEIGLHFQGDELQKSALLDLCRTSRERYADFARQLGEESGLDIELCLPSSPTRDWRSEGIVYVLDERALNTVRALAPTPLSQSWNNREALLVPNEGQVEPRLLCQALRLACEKRGVQLRENARVVSLEAHNGRVAGLRLESGETIQARQFLMCAGAWSGELALADAVFPVAGTMLQLRDAPQIKQVIYGQHCYLVPRRDGRLLVGASVEHVGFDARVRADAVRELLNAAIELAPQLSEATFETSWASVRPMSRDGLPMLGRGQSENLFYATGHGRNGILLAPVTAQLLVEAMCGGVAIDSVFSPMRFL